MTQNKMKNKTSYFDIISTRKYEDATQTVESQFSFLPPFSPILFSAIFPLETWFDVGTTILVILSDSTNCFSPRCFLFDREETFPTKKLKKEEKE